jgi:hypothetical protein
MKSFFQKLLVLVGSLLILIFVELIITVGEAFHFEKYSVGTWIAQAILFSVVSFMALLIGEEHFDEKV